jgi:hypothetical protein
MDRVDTGLDQHFVDDVTLTKSLDAVAVFLSSIASERIRDVVGLDLIIYRNEGSVFNAGMFFDHSEELPSNVKGLGSERSVVVDGLADLLLDWLFCGWLGRVCNVLVIRAKTLFRILKRALRSFLGGIF